MSEDDYADAMRAQAEKAHRVAHEWWQQQMLAILKEDYATGKITLDQLEASTIDVLERRAA